MLLIIQGLNQILAKKIFFKTNNLKTNGLKTIFKEGIKNKFLLSM
jgi:hypothetical protein